MDSALTKDFTTIPRTEYFTGVDEFSLDFIPEFFRIGKSESEDLKENGYKGIQFSISEPNSNSSTWKYIESLPTDPDFFIGMSNSNEVEENPGKPATVPFVNYHAGKFKLNINDSITVFFRHENNKVLTHHFSIKRVKNVPNTFSFLQFSSAASFDQILNNEINKRNRIDAAISDKLDVEPGNSAILRFWADEPFFFYGRYFRNSGIQYAFGDNPGNWSDLVTSKNSSVTNGYGYIFLNSPTPGTAIDLLLRYKHQKESIYKVRINIKPEHVYFNWLKTVIGFLAILSLFILGLYIQNQRNWRKLRALENKKNDIENKLQLLSGQLNPHFLFNSLNAVQTLVKQGDTDNANQYITDVASFMRTVMDSGRKEFVSLTEELAIEKSYVALEQKRKPFELIINTCCKYDLSQIEFPPLLLQPLIENCIRHGFGKTIMDPAIEITLKCERRDLIVIISDNGIGYDERYDYQGHGISLTQRRIKLLNEKLKSMKISMVSQTEINRGTSTQLTFSQWL
jgi:two-component sensor histidine kinase